MLDPQPGRLIRFRAWLTSFREMESFKEMKEVDTELKDSIADFIGAIPPDFRSWQMLYLVVVMFLSLGTFRLIGAVMLLVRIRWLGNWFLERAKGGREQRHEE